MKMNSPATTSVACALVAVASLCTSCESDSGSLNGCSTFEDHTASQSLVVDFGGALGLVYSPSCARIKVNTRITFNGSFAIHPLQAHNGDAGNPFPTTAIAAGTTQEITATVTGSFGYWCQIHGPTSGMQGAIEVVQ